MATAKWTAAGSESADIAGSSGAGINNTLAAGSASGILADIANASGKNLNIRFWLKLASAAFTGGSVQIRLVHKRSSTYIDRNATTFTGESCDIAVPTGTAAKELCSCAMRLPGPFDVGVEVVNNTNVAFAASGNELYYQVWDEDVS